MNLNLSQLMVLEKFSSNSSQEFVLILFDENIIFCSCKSFIVKISGFWTQQVLTCLLRAAMVQRVQRLVEAQGPSRLLLVEA